MTFDVFHVSDPDRIGKMTRMIVDLLVVKKRGESVRREHSS